ncbi:MAG: aminoacyl-tRNA hydrolase [Paludibacteraceae bacterium]|jgi:PTH1 family peptidyl-tRNA hydrolase|nr:aminoacyl-tRNA hydrolase [Paludibacteraceae bacterium]
MKYLIVGLGNIGPEYQYTRHNIGFMMLDAFARASNVFFAEQRYGSVAHCRVKNCELTLLKPNTFMNLSGNAVRYYLQQEKIPVENLLVLLDDLALPFGTLRLKPKGSAGGHNGLKNITALLGTENYARLRFGIGSEYAKGQQVDYVLSSFTEEQVAEIQKRCEVTTEMIKSFCLAGVQLTMTQFNNK